MTIWFKLGWRNLQKNKRRTLFTTGAIALGFAAINLVFGFMLYVFNGLEDSYVYTFEGGHITIQKASPGPTNNFFTPEELDRIESICIEIPEIELVTPRIQFTGMLNYDDHSTIIFANGKVIKDSSIIRQQARGIGREIELFQGAPLSDTTPSAIGVSKGLAKKLEISNGSPVIAMVNTVDGYMNAADAEVVQLQDAPLEILDQMAATFPFSFSQELLDTDGANSMVVLLSDSSKLKEAQNALSRRLKEAGLSTTVQSWKDLRVSYHRIRSMFQVIFGFVLSIVLLIITLSVINTASMSAMERTREIGTLRAIGLKRSGVLALFSSESVILGMLGSTSGCILYLCCWQFIQVLEPTWIPPNIPKRVPWEITWAPHYLGYTFLLMELLTILATLIPARNASRMEVTEALSHT